MRPLKCVIYLPAAGLRLSAIPCLAKNTTASARTIEPLKIRPRIRAELKLVAVAAENLGAQIDSRSSLNPTAQALERAKVGAELDVGRAQDEAGRRGRPTRPAPIRVH